MENENNNKEIKSKVNNTGQHTQKLITSHGEKKYEKSSHVQK